MPADIENIKSNIAKMIEQNAPESDIEEYLGYEGVSIEDLHAPEQGEDSMPLADVPMTALTNMPESATRFASDIVSAFSDPVGTAKNIGKLILGTAQKAIPGEQGYEQNADAVGQYFADRYGGWDELKNTAATDPVGFLADASTVLTGGGSLVARAPAMAGKVGKITQTAGRAIDPLALAGKGAGVAADLVGGLGTHTGGKTIRTAFSSGMEGAEAGEAFRGSMREITPVRDAVDSAREGIANLRRKRSESYLEDMNRLKKIPEQIDFADIRETFNKASLKSERQGRGPVKTQKVSEQVGKLLDEWEELGPEMHTPYVLDLLKQDLWDIQAKFMGKKDSRWAFVNRVRQGVKKTIQEKAPMYTFYMRKYEKASELIREMEGTLSLNPNARIDTTLRKLQSIMRDNANTQYGYRVELGEMLAEAGAPNLIEHIAGQSMSKATPRGLGTVTAGGMAGYGAMNSMPWMVPLLGFTSPRLVGEITHAAGRGVGAAEAAFKKVPGLGISPQAGALGGFQAGRISEQAENY